MAYLQNPDIEMFEEDERLRQVLNKISVAPSDDHMTSSASDAQAEEQVRQMPKEASQEDHKTDLAQETAEQGNGDTAVDHDFAQFLENAPVSETDSEDTAAHDAEASQAEHKAAMAAADARPVSQVEDDISAAETVASGTGDTASEEQQAVVRVNWNAAEFTMAATEGGMSYDSTYGAPCPCPICSGDFSAFEAASGDNVGIPAPAASLGTLATYLNERNTGSTGNDFWDDFWGGGTDVPTPFWNLTASGTNAQSGVITYNVTGNTFDANGISGSTRIDLIRHALNIYEDILGINFVETTSATADLNFGDWDLGRAYANFNQAADGSITNAWINIAQDWSGGAAIGDYYFHTALHEIGHTLGLGHQGNYNAGQGALTWADQAQWENDTLQFTMMSYWAQGNYTPPGEATPSGAFLGSVNVIGPQAVDWLALDRIYNPQGFGIDDGATTGNTTWGFNSSWLDWTPSSGGPAQGLNNTAFASLDTLLATNTLAIVDGGGIDTLDLSGFANNTQIDISITTSSSLAPAFSNVAGLNGNLSIAVGTVIENVVGGAGNELIQGNTVANNLDGGAGNDTINGDDGDDTILGGLGNDSLNAGYGVDSVLGGDGNDTINPGTGGFQSGEVFDGGAGTDLLEFGTYANHYRVDLSLGQFDTISGGFLSTLTNIENVNAGSGNDSIIGSTAGNVLDGGAGNDTLEGRSGNDTLLGGVGNDTLIDSGAGSLLDGGDGDDLFRLDYVSNTTVIGGAGIDTIDILTDGSGITSTTPRIIDVDLGYSFAGGAFQGTWSGIENILSWANIEVTLIGNSSNNLLQAGSQNDTLLGEDGNDTLLGLDGNDSLNGGSGNDSLDGGDGDDTITGGSGTDTLLGGVGNDTLIDSGAGSLLDGGDGDDLFQLDGAGNTTLIGGTGSDTVDFLTDGTAATYTTPRIVDVDLGYSFLGGAFQGTWSGIENILSWANIEVTLIGNTSSNLLQASSQNDTLLGEAGSDTLLGLAGNDSLNGGSGDDSLDGGDGDDVITDNSGMNTFLGGLGNDTLIAVGDLGLLDGGDGDDLFQLQYIGDATVTGGAGIDTIDVLTSGYSGTLTAPPRTVDLDQGYSFDGGVFQGVWSGIENFLSWANVAITLIGNISNNLLQASSQNDVLLGESGDDTLLGLAGNDTLNGGAGNDTMTGGTGNDTYAVGSAGDVVIEYSGEGTDTVQTWINYTLGNFLERLELRGAATTGTGNALNNTLVGNTLDNVLNGAGGDDYMIGGTGNDTYVVDTAGDVVIEYNGQGTDTVQAWINYTLGNFVERLELQGTATNGTGNALNNTLVGNTLDNVLNGAGGDDYMIGGTGNDTYVVDTAGDVVIEYNGQGTDTVQAWINYTLGNFVERLELQGTATNGTGNALNNTLVGNTLDNVLNGAGGDDYMIGGTGNDTYVVDTAGDVVIEYNGQGTDTVQAWINYTLGNFVERLELQGGATNGTGNALNNTLVGNTLDNVLNGATGDDYMIGGTGNDTYVVGSAGDVVIEYNGQGTDTVQAWISYTLGNFVERLELQGGATNGTGNALNNTLVGNSQNNVLDGGDGNDYIRGGLGSDTIYGGAGSDTFLYFNIDESPAGPASRDTIMDFDSSDRINLSGMDADGSGIAGNGTFNWLATSGFTNTAGELRYSVYGSNSIVEADTDGDGVADFQLLLMNVTSLDVNDFTL